MLAGRSVLITGGGGSFGRKFVEHLLMEDKPDRIIIYSRDQHKHAEMEHELSYWKGKLRFFEGDVRDIDRLQMALDGVDIVVHAAALKMVDHCEYNPIEAVKTNVQGTENVVSAVVKSEVDRCIYLSTDKAVEPINLYGCTKATAEKLVIAGNYYAPKFAVVRYGNVMGSRGSVLNFFMNLRKLGNKEFPVTSMEATRFWVTFKEAISLVLKALDEKAGTILASNTKSFKIRDLVKAIYLRSELKEVGMRPGEKIHECILHSREAHRARALPDCYRIFPEFIYGDSILYDREHGRVVEKPVHSNDDANLMVLNEVREKVEQYEKSLKDS